jgi:hypothetical protein
MSIQSNNKKAKNKKKYDSSESEDVRSNISVN